jgi:hypothetical protein
MGFGTPLVLDLNGNGIETQSITGGVEFDLYGTGQKVNTGWISGGDGLLVMDRNGDGQITSGQELFGEATQLSDGSQAETGYQALSDLDSNVDGVINQNDAAFNKLQVWVDGNSDGVSQSEELFKLEQLGITQLDLDAQTSMAQNNGNIVGLTSSYQTTDGQNHDMADVWFLTGKVSNLVQAMSNYSEASGSSNSGLPIDPVAQASQSISTSGTLGQLVGVLNQYDPNGQRLAGTEASAAPSLVPQPNDPNKSAINAFLANGK